MSEKGSTTASELSPVVVDRHVHREKLLELLEIAAEHPELDFKKTTDLGKNSKKSNLDFVKDALAMSNSTRGGYLVFGADDKGQPAHDCAPVNPAHFDSAMLAEKVSAYVTGHVEITSQVHTIDDRDHALVYIAPPSDGVPHMTTKEGRDGNRVIVPKGVIFTRQGTKNVIADSADLRRLLGPFRDRAIAEGRAHVDELIRTLTHTLSGTAGGVPILLDADMPSFTEALHSNLGSGNVKRIERFLRAARRDIRFTPGEDARSRRLHVLDKLALIASEMVAAPDDPLFSLTLEILERSYNSTGFTDIYSSQISNPSDVSKVRHFIDVLTRIYLIGAAAVRENSPAAVRMVAMVPSLTENETFPSWIRHGIVYASRANLLPDTHAAGGGTLIALARQLAHDVPELAAGVVQSSDQGGLDPLLNDLATFDVMWCIAAVAASEEGDAIRVMYPSFASVEEKYGYAILKQIATDAAMRRSLAPSADDSDFARGLDEVLRLASSESFKYSTFWSRAQNMPAVRDFVAQHRQNSY
ncbi:AlbA family DNA-binding domain-containing protein [Microbacterium gubbeenense]|uniref:AlbA family DNA-binding domain-containing protein n=1 Tax=Microbacterium gubbeenense TaxID=159896 RepID=UPI0004075A64|nr:ATP-binding protein [Microbacterium gubbeenense]